MKWRSIISFHFKRVHVYEVTQLEKLLEPIYEIGDVYADNGYLSANNCLVIKYKEGGILISDLKKPQQDKETMEMHLPK